MIARHSAPARRLCVCPRSRRRLPDSQRLVTPSRLLRAAPHNARVDAGPPPRKAGLNPDGTEVHYHESWTPP